MVLRVVRDLNLATAIRLVDAALHRARDAVRIEDSHALRMSRRAADRLDQRPVAA